MPTLDITDEDGNLAPDAQQAVFAVMLFPSEDQASVEKRQDFRFRALYDDFLKADTGSAKPFELQKEDIQRLLSLNTTKIDRDVSKRIQKGWIAGDILLGVEIISRQFPDRASVNKVVDYIQSERVRERAMLAEQMEAKLKEGGKTSRSKPPWEKQSRDPTFNTTETKIREYWSEFKSVAHLWAATNYLKRWCRTLARQEKILPHDYSAFLADAEHLRRFGESHYSRAQKKHENSTLNPAETWKVPQNQILAPARYVEYPPAWRELVNWVLENYKY